jgi:hypothetical protein
MADISGLAVNIAYYVIDLADPVKRLAGNIQGNRVSYRVTRR